MQTLHRAGGSAMLWATAASLALGVPALLAFNLPPSSTFLNQAAALVGWGSWLVVLATSLTRSAYQMEQGLVTLLAAIAILLLCALVSPVWTHLPWSLALSNLGLIAAAGVTVKVAAAAQGQGLSAPAFRAFCIGMVIAGLLSSVVGIIQVFAPAWPDGDWIARTYLDGRAVGNMRQPNHLSSLLLWSIVSAVWLGDATVVKRWLSSLLTLLFIFVVVLTGSRTGTLSVVLLAVWAMLDKRLSRTARLTLLLAPFVYALLWFGTAALADQGHVVFGGEGRFSGKGDISSSRYGIWMNTLSLIRMHPWFGVGFGELNFAWTLTPFPGRPVAFFDHTHNLILQFAVELGIPLALLVLSLLGWSLYCALRDALQARSNSDPAQAPVRRAAFVMVFLILVHSLLEYPLWYAYFLLPAAFAFGLCLGKECEVRDPDSIPVPTAHAWPLLLGSMALMLGGFLSVADYARVVVIFAPSEDAAPLAQRIESGRSSVFFAHHADYAAVTTSDRPADAMESFKTATHYLLDARLLLAWAKALDEAGDTERARYVAQRLKEFRNEAADSFFAPCTEPHKPDAVLPFQCTPPATDFKYEDFR